MNLLLSNCFFQKEEYVLFNLVGNERYIHYCACRVFFWRLDEKCYHIVTSFF